jgi:hypothetical protein
VTERRSDMLYAFGFEAVAVVMSDLYFVNPDPEEGQEGPERGVRIELRFLQRGELQGSIYSAQPIAVDRPVWRADLLEAVDSAPGSLDRAHHHPRFDGWEPGRRHFVAELSARPLEWVGERLSDLDGLLVTAGVSPADVGPADAGAVRGAVPEILDAARRLLDGVAAGDLGRPESGRQLVAARIGWL